MPVLFIFLWGVVLWRLQLFHLESVSCYFFPLKSIKVHGSLNFTDVFNMFVESIKVSLWTPWKLVTKKRYIKLLKKFKLNTHPLFSWFSLQCIIIGFRNTHNDGLRVQIEYFCHLDLYWLYFTGSGLSSMYPSISV